MKPQFFSTLALLLSLTSSTLAQENQELGRMWTFENPPLAYLEEEYGFKPDQEWLNSLRLGSLRLGGEDVLSGFWSASFVSPKGLIMKCGPIAHRPKPRSISDALRGAGWVGQPFVVSRSQPELVFQRCGDESGID